jgi:hypothetical protein
MVALGRPRHVQWSFDGEELADVVDIVHAVRFRPYTARTVADDCVRGPTVPEGLHHLHELGRTSVAEVVVGHGLVAKVLVAAHRSHDIPFDSPVAEQIEARELTGHAEQL